MARTQLAALAAALALAPGPGGDHDGQAAEEILTALVCAECSTCPPGERVSVAAVAIRRAGSTRFRDLEGAILAPGQFADLDGCDRKGRRHYRRYARAALRGYDPTPGATLFHARWACRLRPGLCTHPDLGQCLDTVWPGAPELEVPESWRHRFYLEARP